MPTDNARTTRSTFPLKLHKIYYLFGGGVTDLFDDAVIDAAGLTKGRSAAFAFILPLRHLHHIRLRPRPSATSVPPGPAGKPFTSSLNM